MTGIQPDTQINQLARAINKLSQEFTQLEHVLNAKRANGNGNAPNRSDDDDDMLAADIADAAIYDTLDAPLTTLGAVRLHARALLEFHDEFQDTAVGRLLKALEAIPERLWDENIGAV